MELSPFEDDRAALTEKKNVNAFHGDELMKKHNYALQKADKPRLRSSTQNICSVISISAVVLKLMIKITSIFVSYRFLRMAWHYTFCHFQITFQQAGIQYISPVILRRSRRANAHLHVSSLTSGRVKGS